MTVYLLYAFDYEHYEVLGVFDTAEAAEATRQALGHRNCGVTSYAVQSEISLEFGVRAWVTRTWKTDAPEQYEDYSGYLDPPSTRFESRPWDVVEHTPGPDAYAPLRSREYSTEYWEVSSRSASHAVALLREALGPRWTAKLERKFSETLLEDE